VTAFSIRPLSTQEVADRTGELRAIYAQVYREPPYNEGEQHADDFARHLVDQSDEVGFRLVTAEASGGSLVGFSYGLTFPANRWWRNADDEPQLIRGHPKFAIIELAVISPWRRHGIGTALMSRLLADRPEPFGTLCTNPASSARAIYDAWGWQQVGTTRQPNIGHMDVLVKALQPTGD